MEIAFLIRTRVSGMNALRAMSGRV